MARNNPKPTDKIDWDATGNIITPNSGRKTSGWLFEVKPPAENFNWKWELDTQNATYLLAQAQDWIVIDSDADEGDYATIQAYIADAPAAGDRILVKEDQTLTAQLVLPSSVTLKFLDGARLLCATNIATSVLRLGSNIIIESVLKIVLSQTGTIGKAVEIDGDNAIGKINVENSSTGILTTAYHINANKTGNRFKGFLENTGGGTITNEWVDNSTEDSNLLIIFDDPNSTIRTNGTAFIDLLNDQDIAGFKNFTGVLSIENSAPGFRFRESDAPADSKSWYFAVNGQVMTLRLFNDAEGAFNSAFSITRSGTVAQTMNIQTTNLWHNGVSVVTTSSVATLLNKTLGTGTKIALGSDADGDIYYRDAGILKRLAKGADEDFLILQSGIPSWDARHGVYTPTVTSIANYTSSSPQQAFWHRVGDVVTISGLIASLTVPSAGVLTRFRIDLPVASNIGAASDAGGSGGNVNASDVDAVHVEGDSVNDEIIFFLFPSTTSNGSISYQISYKVI